MLNFPKDYPDAAKILLDRNFRSSSRDHPCSTDCDSQKIQNRFEKQITCGARQQALRSISVNLPARSTRACICIKAVQECHYSAAHRQMRSLFYSAPIRVHARYAERLMEFNLPFEMRDALPNIYEHWVAKGPFRLPASCEEAARTEQSFLQVMNRPKRYIKP